MSASAADRPGHPEVRLLKRRKACVNGKFEVFMDHVRMPDGHAVEDFMVVSPRVKAPGLVTGVAVLPLWEGGIGLLLIHRHALRALSWEIPRGFVDAGEDPRTSASRELLEETGLSCAPRALKPLGLIAPESGMLSARLRLFLAARCVRRGAFLPGQDGHAELRFLSPSRVESMILRSEIQDPSTIAAFYRAAPFLP